MQVLSATTTIIVLTLIYLEWNFLCSAKCIPRLVYSANRCQRNFQQGWRHLAFLVQPYEFMHESNNPICSNDMQQHKEEKNKGNLKHKNSKAKRTAEKLLVFPLFPPHSRLVCPPTQSGAGRVFKKSRIHLKSAPRRSSVSDVAVSYW